jgi:hypothetical protein
MVESQNLHWSLNSIYWLKKLDDHSLFLSPLHTLSSLSRLESIWKTLVRVDERYRTPWLLRPYSKSSLTLNEWRFNLSFPWVSVLFLNTWRVSNHIARYDTSPPAIQKQHWHSREAQIEPPLIECEWAFRIRALGYVYSIPDWFPLRREKVPIR